MKNNNNRKIISLIFMSIVATSSSIIVPSILFSKSTKNIESNQGSDHPSTPEIPSITDSLFPTAPWNGELFSSNDMYRITSEENTNEYFETANGYLEKILEKGLERQINNKVYDTALMQEWKTRGLVSSRGNNAYPAYDFNWQIINKWGMQFAQDIVKEYYAKVNEETAESKYWTGSPVKWNNFEFIRNEIKNNNLKKHPAADMMHDPSLFVKNDTKAISKEFMYAGNRNSIYNTGMYAAPGEVITLELTPEQFELWKSNNYKGINILINYQSFDQPRELGNSGMMADRYPYTQVLFNFDKLKYGTPGSTISDTSDWILDSDGMYKYQFGSPFGGSIAIQYKSTLKVNNEITPIKFKISGGIEEVHYIQGQTTKEEWMDQIKRVQTGEITAPNIAIDSYWFNAVCNMYNMYQFYKSDGGTPNHFRVPEKDHITTTSDIRIGGYGIWFTFSSEKTLDQLAYPYEMVKKWDTFLMLSNFMIRADVTNNPYKEIMRFGPEVWGGAVGWGGSYQFWSYPDTFTQMFFSGYDVLCASGNWLAMHEINHGYEPSNWNFNNLEHGVTNQVTVLNLSVMGDVARYRNLFNINGEWNNEWSRLVTPYGNVKSSKLDCYSIFSDYLYMAGTGKTFEYARWQQANAGKNGYPKYGGLYEIYVMSRFAGQNFYYALRDLYAGKDFLPISKDGTNLSSEDSKLVNELSKLPSIDILGNIYASGIYLYDYLTNQYIYTNDVVPAFEIPAGINSYTFDFEQGIKSRNQDFQFEIKEYPSTTKLGGKLQADPNNAKKLIYTPPVAKSIDDYANIDEFDLEIRPTHTNKYDNYVPGYKFKIKIRQNAKSANVNLENIDYAVEKVKFVENKNNQTLTARFLAPEDGSYTFAFKNNSKLTLKKSNGTIIVDKSNIQLNKGDFIDVEYKNFNGNEREFKVTKDNTSIDFFENIYSPYISPSLINLDLASNTEIDYKPRFASTNGIGYWANKYVQMPYENKVWQSIDPKKFNVTYTHGSTKKDANIIKYKNENPFRINFANTIPTIEFQYTFNEPTKLSSLVFYAGVGAYSPWKPKGLKIIAQRANGETIEINDNGNFISYANLPSVPYDTKYKYLNLKEPIDDLTSMEIIIEKETGQYCLDLIWINLMSNYIDSECSNFIPATSSFIKYDGWSIEQNSFEEEKNFSIFNNSSCISNKKNSTVEFEIFGNGFSLIGKKPNKETLIDIYIDDNLVEENLNIGGDKNEYNRTLYSWFDSNTKNHNIKVKIVLKSDSPLYINGIGISSELNTIGRIINIKK